MIRNSLKILIPILGFGRAGGMRVLSQLANHWNKQGHNVSMVSFYESEDQYYPCNVEKIWINMNGQKVERNNTRYKNKYLGLRRMYATYNFIKRNSHKYDIVLANQNFTTWPIILGSKTNNFYYIQAYEPEFYTKSSLKSRIQSLLAKFTYYLPLKRIVNADIYKKYKGLRANRVIPPGLDLQIFNPKAFNDYRKEEFVIGCIGRIEEWKGSNDVTEAIKILHEKGYNVKYRVAFNPVNYDKFELVKPDGDKNLADFYRSLDILVAPGHIQLGAVHYPVIEAMACKTPVITTGYYPANNENAYIVPVKNPSLIANTIIEIMEDYEKATEKAEIAYKTVSQFDWKIVSAKFIDIFNAELKGEKE